MNTKCGKCGSELPADQEYPDYCCPTPSAAARSECGCGGWEQPHCQECLDVEKARRMAPRMTAKQRKELGDAMWDIDEELRGTRYLSDVDCVYCAIRSYRAAQAYIETVDRLLPEVV